MSVCPSCSREVASEWGWCPGCGERLRTTCVRCHKALDSSWRFCPRCGAALDLETYHSVLPKAMRSTEAAALTEAEGHNQRGIEFYDREDYPQAIEQLLRAVELDPTNPLYHGNLAVAYHDFNLPEQAMTHYQRALELDPSDITCHLNLGQLYASLEDYQSAVACWRKVLSLAPDGPEAEEARQALQAAGEL